MSEGYGRYRAPLAYPKAGRSSSSSNSGPLNLASNSRRSPAYPKYLRQATLNLPKFFESPTDKSAPPPFIDGQRAGAFL